MNYLCFISVTVNEENVLSGRIYDPAGTLSIPIPQCALAASTYVGQKRVEGEWVQVELQELVGTVVLPPVKVGEGEEGDVVVDLGELTFHVRENVNAPGFGTVLVDNPYDGFVAEMWQTLWSNEDPAVTRPEFPEGGLVYEHKDPESGEIVDTYTFYDGGQVELADKYEDETHWTNNWTAPMTVWASFGGDGQYEIRVPTIDKWRNGDWRGSNGNWSNDFYMPISGPVTAEDIEKRW